MLKTVLKVFGAKDVFGTMKEWLDEFQASQPRKERRNITIAYHKKGRGEPLNKYDKEAIEKFNNFVINKLKE